MDEKYGLHLQEDRLEFYNVNTHIIIKITAPEYSNKLFESIPFGAEINVNGEICFGEDHNDDDETI